MELFKTSKTAVNVKKKSRTRFYVLNEQHILQQLSVINVKKIIAVEDATMSFHGSNIKERSYFYYFIFNFTDHFNDLGPVSRRSGNISDPESCFDFLCLHPRSKFQ